MNVVHESGELVANVIAPVLRMSVLTLVVVSFDLTLGGSLNQQTTPLSSKRPLGSIKVTHV